MEAKIVKTWDLYLDKIPNEKKDIYFSEAYVKLIDEEKARCLIIEEGNNILLLPFIRNRIRNNFDFETPYGYGGPISNSEDQIWISKAIVLMKMHFENNGYIAGFIRFHPLLNNQILLPEFDLFFDRNTVAIDTSKDEESIWKSQISSKNRNMIRKAEKNGLHFIADYDYKYLSEFIFLYNTTMARLEADSFYLFKDEYFQNLKNSLKSSFLGVIKDENDKVVSSAIFFSGEKFAHYHLAGSLRDRKYVGANNLLLWNACKIFSKERTTLFHLGGGTDSDLNNSLYKFKTSFSKTIQYFYIAKLVFNKQIYEKICIDWETNNPEKVKTYSKLLLKYRY